MAVHITGRETVALYDSDTEIAFGPVFYSSADAYDFRQWLRKDARQYTNSRLVELKEEWEREQRDGDNDVEIYGAGV